MQPLTPRWAREKNDELRKTVIPLYWERYYYVLDEEGWHALSPVEVERLREGGATVISYNGMTSLEMGLPSRSECEQAYRELTGKYSKDVQTLLSLNLWWDRQNKTWVVYDSVVSPTSEANRWISCVRLIRLMNGRGRVVPPEF